MPRKHKNRRHFHGQTASDKPHPFLRQGLLIVFGAGKNTSRREIFCVPFPPILDSATAFIKTETLILESPSPFLQSTSAIKE